MTTPSALDAWLRRHWFVLALLVVIVGGYTFGKDMALRDNARDRAEHHHVEPRQD